MLIEELEDFDALVQKTKIFLVKETENSQHKVILMHAVITALYEISLRVGTKLIEEHDSTDLAGLMLGFHQEIDKAAENLLVKYAEKIDGRGQNH